MQPQILDCNIIIRTSWRVLCMRGIWIFIPNVPFVLLVLEMWMRGGDYCFICSAKTTRSYSKTVKFISICFRHIVFHAVSMITIRTPLIFRAPLLVVVDLPLSACLLRGRELQFASGYSWRDGEDSPSSFYSSSWAHTHSFTAYMHLQSYAHILDVQ